MRLEQTPRPEQTLRVSARLITSSTILHLSSDELERAVNQEQIENPALEVAEQKICLFCGTHIYGQTCTACGQAAGTAQPLTQLTQASHFEPGAEYSWADYYQGSSTYYDIDNYGFAEIDNDDASDPLARIPTGETLAEALLQQLETLIPPEDAPIAEQLVGNLNERGYLEISVEEIAAYLQVTVERVEYVLSQLQALEPLGIGARNPRECLLIQLHVLSEQSQPHPLAHTLIDQYLDQLGKNQYNEIARKLSITEQEVRQAAHYIRSTLHPFPAHMYDAGNRSPHIDRGTTYIRPDIIIRKGHAGFEIEIVEEKRYQFTIETRYTGVDQEGQSTNFSSQEIQRYMHHHSDRAKFFVECIQRRWRTLRRIAELVVDYQREFLNKGVRYLRPLTRAEVATRLNLDEGTVSRATANKYVLLPNGRLIPFSDFFDGSLGVKDILRDLIQSEDPRHRLSDEELARLMTSQGIPMARRTVTKYREEMGIGSSRER
jgi:RNA polymerase sigma-54 factor